MPLLSIHHRKITFVVSAIVSTFAAAGFEQDVSGQDRVPMDEARRIGARLVAAVGDPTDSPVKFSVDAEQADAIRAGEIGLMVIPDRQLTAAVIEQAGAEYVPVGYLLLKGVLPSVERKPVAADQLRSVSITAGDQTVKLNWCMLAARKQNGKLELALIGSDKKPFLQVPLAARDTKSGLLLRITGEKQDDETGLATLSIAEKFEATVTVKLP